MARARALGSMKTLVMNRHGHRIEHARAHGLKHAKRDQYAEARRRAAQRRGSREQREPDLEDATATEAVGERPGEHEQTRQHERVGRSTTHCRPAVVAPRSRRMAGSATFTIVTSIETKSRLRQQMASTSFGRSFVVDTQLL